jgi:hypothetical protein
MSGSSGFEGNACGRVCTETGAGVQRSSGFWKELTAALESSWESTKDMAGFNGYEAFEKYWTAAGAEALHDQVLFGPAWNSNPLASPDAFTPAWEAAYAQRLAEGKAQVEGLDGLYARGGLGGVAGMLIGTVGPGALQAVITRRPTLGKSPFERLLDKNPKSDFERLLDRDPALETSGSQEPQGHAGAFDPKDAPGANEGGADSDGVLVKKRKKSREEIGQELEADGWEKIDDDLQGTQHDTYKRGDEYAKVPIRSENPRVATTDPAAVAKLEHEHIDALRQDPALRPHVPETQLRDGFITQHTSPGVPFDELPPDLRGVAQQEMSRLGEAARASTDLSPELARNLFDNNPGNFTFTVTNGGVHAHWFDPIDISVAQGLLR